MLFRSALVFKGNIQERNAANHVWVDLTLQTKAITVVRLLGYPRTREDIFRGEQNVLAKCLCVCSHVYVCVCVCVCVWVVVITCACVLVNAKSV